MTFDEVFALAVELGYQDYQLPTESSNLEARFEQLKAAKRNVESYYSSASGLLDELRALGIPLPDYIQQLALHPDLRAVPVLIRWLPRIDDPNAKSEVISMLETKWAQPDGKQALFAEYDRIERIDQALDPSVSSIRYSLVDALSRLATESDFGFFLRVASDPANGKARTLAASVLGRWKRQRAKSVPVLMGLLEDDSDSVYWSAAHALGLLREHSAEIPIQKRLDIEQDSYKRQKLTEALKRIQSAS